ncbi:MAG TPA: hypothetical protein VF173_11485 [Thermoanaerobaculia bacterium]|nr:hypothetical protein [Thermoanaerobaculia bacterium]
MHRPLYVPLALVLALGSAAPGRAQHEGHDMQHMDDMPGMHEMHAMQGMLGSYGMTREASGTAWQPESAPHEGQHTTWNGWHLMAHGFASLIYDRQGGPRGESKTFSENMLMGMATRPLGPGRLGLRAMLSAEPETIGREGYPLLLQTGETADGVTPLIDRQHPHDLFMELAATYSVPVGGAESHSSVFLYAGLPGEPALGPATFMHRFSGMENPEAPLGHHWLDSTHVTFGVATLGWIRDGVKLEGSVFTGREPDQNRNDIESPKMDSWSLRATWNPSPDWSFQVSRGHLHSPEQLEPEIDDDRTTASAVYNRPLAAGNWQTTFAWGRNSRDPGTATNSFLLESAVTLGDRNTVFGRVEKQQNDELGGHGEGQAFDVGKLSLGYIWDGLRSGSFRGGLGVLGSVAFVPRELKHDYGDTPFSWMTFLRVRM